jgi:hypothetical protein
MSAHPHHFYLDPASGKKTTKKKKKTTGVFGSSGSSSNSSILHDNIFTDKKLSLKIICQVYGCKCRQIKLKAVFKSWFL